jgi:hypothetical protein
MHGFCCSLVPLFRQLKQNKHFHTHFQGSFLLLWSSSFIFLGPFSFIEPYWGAPKNFFSLLCRRRRHAKRKKKGFWGLDLALSKLAQAPAGRTLHLRFWELLQKFGMTHSIQTRIMSFPTEQQLFQPVPMGERA